MARGDTRERKWKGNCRMEWVASTLHTTSEHGVSSITTFDAHTSTDSSRLNWRLRWFKWTRPFRRKTKSGFWACAITFQTQSTPPFNTLLKKCLITSLTLNVAKSLDRNGHLQAIWHYKHATTLKLCHRTQNFIVHSLACNGFNAEKLMFKT